MNRGDRQDAIFHDDVTREVFLQTLEEACRKTDWQIHAWCLMTNHFHLVVETPRVNLVAGMKDEVAAGHLHDALQPAAEGCGWARRHTWRTCSIGKDK